jgi:hypothetical protein
MRNRESAVRGKAVMQPQRSGGAGLLKLAVLLNLSRHLAGCAIASRQGSVAALPNSNRHDALAGNAAATRTGPGLLGGNRLARVGGRKLGNIGNRHFSSERISILYLKYISKYRLIFARVPRIKRRF